VALRAGAQYVSIGSSYSVGYLIKPQVTGANPCGRSLVDYPHLVAKKLHLHLADAGCAGAVTANALNTDQGSQPPQIDAVTSKTRLVTMTIGGNDVDYIGTAGACGSHPDCASTADRTQLNAEFTQLPHSLTKLIRAIRAKAPKVTIVMVTYPRLVPKSSCAALHYNASADTFVGSIGARLEKVFVQVAKSTHILIADPYQLGAGHGPCAVGTKAWVAGQHPTNGAAYHPTAAGHREMAHLIEKALATA
jgi:lysophospholipase L1-like esterase